MAEYHLAIHTNGSVFLQGEIVKVLCRIVSKEGKLIDAFPQVEFQMFEFADTPVHVQERRRIDASFFPSPIEKALGVTAISLSSDGMKPGAYVLQALDRHPAEDTGVRETQFLILSPADYERYWIEMAEEKFLEDKVVASPEDFLRCLRDLIKESLAQKLRISSIEIGLDLLDRRGHLMFGALRPVRRAQFEWFYYHLFQACYDKVFYGGNINVSMMVEQEQLTSSFLLTSRTGGIREGLPHFLDYVLKGIPAHISLKSTQLSEHQFKIITQFPYEAQVAENQKS